MEGFSQQQRSAHLERVSLTRDFVRDYFSDLWNLFDFMLIFTNIVTIALSFMTSLLPALIISKCLLLVFTFIKLCFYMRISDGFSFLVSMLIGVFKDLKFFFFFYLIILIMFSLMFFCLALTLDDNL